MQEELLKCPFCGSSPEITFISVADNFVNYDEIHCPMCLREGLCIAHAVKRFTNTVEHEFVKEELVYEWNKRVIKIHENMK